MLTKVVGTGGVAMLALVAIACGAQPPGPLSAGQSPAGQSQTTGDQGGAITDPSCAAGAGFAAPTCQSNRDLLSCTRSDGQQELCLSAVATCSDTGSAQCTDRCQPNEFGVECGSMSIPAMDPPGCRKVYVTTVGIILYCCPCSAAAPDGGG